MILVIPTDNIRERVDDDMPLYILSHFNNTETLQSQPAKHYTLYSRSPRSSLLKQRCERNVVLSKKVMRKGFLTL